MGYKYHDIAKSAGSQTNNTTAWLQNSAKTYQNYQKAYLKDFRLGILGNEKVLEKSQIRWRKMLVPSLPSRNNFLVIAVKILM